MTDVIQKLADNNGINIKAGTHGIYNDNVWCCLQYAYDVTETIDAYFDKMEKLIKQFQNLAEKSFSKF